MCEQCATKAEVWRAYIRHNSGQAAQGSVRTYSEIVWLEASWTAPTRANANRTTGLPNSYLSSGNYLITATGE